MSQVADGTGDVWTYAYDAAGHLLSVTAPGDLTTAYTYDTGSNPETANALLSVTNPDGSQQNFTYDSTPGRLTGTSANGGADRSPTPTRARPKSRPPTPPATRPRLVQRSRPAVARCRTRWAAFPPLLYDNNGNLVGYTDAAGDNYQYTYDSRRQPDPDRQPARPDRAT